MVKAQTWCDKCHESHGADHEAGDGDGGGPQGVGVLPQVVEAEDEAVPGVHPGLAPQAVPLVVRGAAGGGQQRPLGRLLGVEELVVPPYLPGLLHLLREEAAALEVGLGEVPRQGHRPLPRPRHVVPHLRHHLRLHRPLHLGEGRGGGPGPAP